MGLNFPTMPGKHTQLSVYPVPSAPPVGSPSAGQRPQVPGTSPSYHWGFCPVPKETAKIRGLRSLKQIAYFLLLVALVRHCFHCSCGTWEKKTQNRLGQVRRHLDRGPEGASGWPLWVIRQRAYTSPSYLLFVFSYTNTCWSSSGLL